MVTNLFLSISNRISVKVILTLIIIVSAAFSVSIVINSYTSYKALKLPEDIIWSSKKNIATKSPDYSQIRNLFSETQAPSISEKNSNLNTTRLSSVNSIDFVGSVITKNKKVSFLKKDGNIFILEEGESLDGYTVKKIKKFKIILSKNGKNYVLYYKGSDTTSISKPEFKEKVEKEVIKLSKLEVQKETEDIGKLLKNIRIVPVVKGGETLGFRFTYINPKSPLYKYGLRSGDLIKSINGMPVKTAEEAFKIYNMLRNEQYITVEIERKGKKKVITYEIQ